MMAAYGAKGVSAHPRLLADQSLRLKRLNCIICRALYVVLKVCIK